MTRRGAMVRRSNRAGDGAGRGWDGATVALFLFATGVPSLLCSFRAVGESLDARPPSAGRIRMLPGGIGNRAFCFPARII
jgi:hypothetical protein